MQRMGNNISKRVLNFSYRGDSLKIREVFYYGGGKENARCIYNWCKGYW